MSWGAGRHIDGSELSWLSYGSVRTRIQSLACRQRQTGEQRKTLGQARCLTDICVLRKVTVDMRIVHLLRSKVQ